MGRISVVGYATIMDPENARRLGLAGTPDIVWINEYQRFFGFPDYNLAGKSLEDVFDEGGNLTVRDIGATTIVPSSSHRHNAVIYNDVPEAVLCDLDRIEGESHLDRVQLDRRLVRYFQNNSEWRDDDTSLFVYIVKDQIEVLGRGILTLVRGDVNPNAGYLAKCRAAASVQGSDFRAAYEDTTFLADRKTTLRESGP